LDKEHIRTQCKESLHQFSTTHSGQLRIQAELQLQKRLIDFLNEERGIWGAYQPMTYEPRILETYQQTQNHMRWAYPRVVYSGLDWWVPGKLGFEKGKLGFQEPKMELATPIPLADVDGILIPGLGFDRQGMRLGRGRGDFDKTLEKYKGKKVAVAFSCQVVDRIPSESHDVKMDYVITEKEVISC
jgi:5-formyltetrahydrofolate cyclo-ligase